MHLPQQVVEAVLRGAVEGQRVEAALTEAHATVRRLHQGEEGRAVDVAAHAGVLLGAAEAGIDVPAAVDDVQVAAQAAEHLTDIVGVLDDVRRIAARVEIQQ